MCMILVRKWRYYIDCVMNNIHTIIIIIYIFLKNRVFFYIFKEQVHYVKYTEYSGSEFQTIHFTKQ